jgi:flagellar basal-body rod protein FlgG
MFLQNKIDVTANNIANSKTTAYKKDYINGESFRDILTTKVSDRVTIMGDERINPSVLEVYTPGVYARATSVDLNRGELRETGHSSDITTEQGYFIVDSPEGEIYLSSVSTQIDAEGFLVVPGKGRIRGNFGEIYIGDKYHIESNGAVTSGGRIVDRLQVVEFIDESQLFRTNRGDLTTDFNNVNEINEARVRAGYLEESNVDLAEEMANLMEISRKFETNQRTMHILDELYGKAINEVGKV